MMSKVQRFILILVAILAVFTFQNCGNVYVVSKPSVAEVKPLTTFNINGNICSEVGAESSSPLKILFLVDMSLSNVGGNVTRESGNAYNHFLCQNVLIKHQNDEALMAYCSTPANTPTDPSGVRFQAMKNFLSPDSACAQISQSAQIEFSVVGFGTDTLFPAGYNQTCESAFESSPTAVNGLMDGLKSIQDRDLALPSPYPGGSGSPYLMGATNYLKGLNCMAEKLGKDSLQDRTILPFYYNVFLSDGAATDAEDMCSQYCPYPYYQTQCTTCLINNNCDLEARTCARNTLIPKVIEKTKREVLPFSSGFKFQPVYYNGEGTGSDYGAAEPLLNAMAQAGGVSGPIRLSNNTEMALLQEKVCSSIEKSLKTKYRVVDSFIVNLTARMDKGVLVADSDIDGLTDITEKELKTNPSHARSNGKILDSICAKDGSYCSTALACAVTGNVGFGFTNCELDYMRKESISNSLTDSNENGINDFIEIIKGGNAYSNVDAMSDTDEDRLGYFFEIANGYDLKNSDLLFEPKSIDLMNARISAARPAPGTSCPSDEELFSINVSSLPLAEVEAYNDPIPGPLSLTHLKNQNVFAVFYSAQEIGGLPNTKKKHYVYLFKVQYGAASVDVSIKPGDFIEFPEVSK